MKAGVPLDSCLQLIHTKLVFDFLNMLQKISRVLSDNTVLFLRCRYAFPLRPFSLWPKGTQTSISEK